MKVLLDTNVVLDVLLQRGAWLAEADAIWQASVDDRLESCITTSSLTDIYYISRRLVGEQAAREAVRKCLDVLTILTVDKDTLEQAHALAVADFEDALQVSAAARNGLDALVTRDPDDFAACPISVLSPTDLVTQLRQTAG
jgi:predicted nucleic acid-binding protein